MAEGEQKKSESKKPESEAPAYDRERLIAEADVLLDNEYPGYIVAGALTQLKGTGPVTAEQTRQAIDKFLKSEPQEA